MHLEIYIAEHKLPEEPCPWFEVETDGEKWRGQATNPPIPQKDGTVLFSLDLELVG